MSVKYTQDNVEIDYINTMLNAEESTVVKDDANHPHNESILVDVKNQGNLYQLFLISGFKVAVLQSEILTDKKIAISDKVDGVLSYESDDYKVIDIGFLINPSGGLSTSNQYILLKKQRLALPHEELLGQERIDKKTICWRNENSQRLWLAGTVKDRNILLLDIQSL